MRNYYYRSRQLRLVYGYTVNREIESRMEGNLSAHKRWQPHNRETRDQPSATRCGGAHTHFFHNHLFFFCLEKMASIDPFERSRTNTLQDIFDDDPDYQWHIELGEKLGIKYPRKENSDGDKHRRVVTRMWPRDPNGEIMRDMADGYSTPNSTRLWGNTLMDFFKANRIPSVTNFIGTCTGSILLGWMKANGELEHAKSEIAWAEAEEPPRLRPAADVMELITARDLMIMMGTCGISMRDDSDDEQEEVGFSIFFFSDHG